MFLSSSAFVIKYFAHKFNGQCLVVTPSYPPPVTPPAMTPSPPPR